jgi:hypothetical protein
LCISVMLWKEISSWKCHLANSALEEFLPGAMPGPCRIHRDI